MREKKRRLGTVKKDGSIVPVTATANKLAFRNGSVIYTDNTFRGGTTQFMHVSELAKMAKRFPDRAREVVNGGFESVPTNGTIIVESTHEGGRSGVNYNLMKTAMSNWGSLFSRWIGGFSFSRGTKKAVISWTCRKGMYSGMKPLNISTG